MKINITEKAAEQLQNMLQEQELSDKKIRIKMTGIGWGGPRFGVALDEQNEDDTNLKADQFDLIIDRRLADSIKYLTIDYTNFLFSKGFHVHYQDWDSYDTCC